METELSTCLESIKNQSKWKKANPGKSSPSTPPRSTFWGVDFAKRTERKRLLEAIDQFVGLLFNALQEEDRVREIARKLKEKGVSAEVIEECTGVKVEI